MKVILHTANVLRNHNQAGPRDPQTELLQGIEATLSHGERLIRKDSIAQISDRKCHPNGTAVDSEDLNIAVKLFMNTRIEAGSVRQAATILLDLLGVPQLDSFVVSMAGTLESETSREDLSEDFIKAFLPVWKELESLVQSKVVKTIGVSDFNKVQLEQVWSLVEIKPSINLVNIDDCCTIPKDLVAFSKEHNVELLTHSDKPEIISEESLLTLIAKKNLSESPLTKLNWIVRYSSMLRNRGIVHDKAFVLALE